LVHLYHLVYAVYPAHLNLRAYKENRALNVLSVHEAQLAHLDQQAQ
jgi:hypothetical protein